MKKKLAILGSTGSIGKSLLDIVKNDKDNFEICLLTAKKNYKSIIEQAKYFNVKNIIITDYKFYKISKSENKNRNINIYNNFDDFEKIFKKKMDYVMSSIIGIDGLYPTIKIIKHTKKIVIANKEAIICGWNLIKKELKKNNTLFLPVDSEHFSIWKITKFKNFDDVDKIFLTASGGPFLKKTANQIKNVTISESLKHPNWKMGKKISIDSATMMNKIFEVIETKNIFSTTYKKISILIHPDSYIHAIIKFNDGTSHLLAHDTSMKIPIFNTLYDNNNKIIKTKELDLNKLNKLNLQKIDKNFFPLLNILELIPEKTSLFETILVATNDECVNLFLNKKIKFHEISKNIMKFIRLNEFQKYKKIHSFNIKDIVQLNEYVRLKISTLGV
jgi:1-deoxy-D-xylulose-5-phosphate reductoisomerase